MFLVRGLARILTREQSTNTNNVIRSKSPANNKSLLAFARLSLYSNVTSSQEETLSFVRHPCSWEEASCTCT